MNLPIVIVCGGLIIAAVSFVSIMVLGYKYGDKIRESFMEELKENKPL